jgi:hypothetical protein
VTVTVTVTVTVEGDEVCGHRSSSMRAMRSMRGGFISRSRGPLQKVCHDPARMSVVGAHGKACGGRCERVGYKLTPPSGRGTLRFVTWQLP